MRLSGTRGWILVEDIYERFAQKLAYNMLKILSTQNHTDFETLHGILFFAICFDKYCTSCQSFEVLKIKGTIDETMSIQLKTALLCLDLSMCSEMLCQKPILY